MVTRTPTKTKPITGAILQPQNRRGSFSVISSAKLISQYCARAHVRPIRLLHTVLESVTIINAHLSGFLRRRLSG